VCETKETHGPIDLTQRAAYCIGRSPTNHIALQHRTSSRRHAVMFHHPSGACYILDCRSAHGTYVNGNRVPPMASMRVRRGSLIRFGGPGAPSFILKCFSTDLDRMVRDLGGVADAFVRGTASRECRMLQQQTQKSGVACIRGEGGMACIVDEQDAPTAALVLLNTRLNACGGMSSLSQQGKSLALEAKAQFQAKFQKNIYNKRERSDNFTFGELSYAQKKISCSLQRSILVAHETGATEKKEVNTSLPKVTEILDVRGGNRIPSKTRVSFSDEHPIVFYPVAVTPDELSSDSEGEDDDQIVMMKPVVMPFTVT